MLGLCFRQPASLLIEVPFIILRLIQMRRMMDRLIRTIAKLSKVKTQTTQLKVDAIKIVIEKQLKHLSKTKKSKSFIKL
jgi:hypothetical protein